MKLQAGERFSRFTVISQSSRRKYFTCRCDCGTIKDVRGDHLKYGKTQSCGCLHKEQASARSAVMHAANVKHGLSGSRIYSVWRGILSRCENRKATHFHSYGGRGISVCERWHSFDNFLADMGIPDEGMTIDRINNDGNYEPGNCRWATRGEQSLNLRNTRLVEIEGVTYKAAILAKLAGMKTDSIVARAQKYATLAEVLSPGKYVFRDGLSMTPNSRTKTHCKHGHEYTKENTYWTPAGYRQCRACHAVQNEKRKPKRRKSRPVAS